MPDIRLILTDIDGTILPYGQREVSMRTRAAFHAALDAGIRVGVATGRGHGWLAPLFGGDEACCDTAVATNGNEIVLDGRTLRVARMEHAELRLVADFIGSVAGAGLLCFSGDTPLLVRGSRNDLALVMPSYAAVCMPVDTVPFRPIVKANVFFAPGLADEGGLELTALLAEQLEEAVPALDFDVPQRGFINLMPDGWSKATGIDVMCEALGISIDQVVVFGDGGNDVSMLSHVPHSVAVEGASADAAAAARWHIGRCEDEAVARAIEMLAKGMFPFGEEACHA